ncbi:NACHT and WD repeat domain-containing protein [Amycolatopsis sp. NPDC004747]
MAVETVESRLELRFARTAGGGGQLTSNRPSRHVLDLSALILGIVFGFGTNLITSSPENWWPPLRLVADYAKFWLPFTIIVVVAFELLSRRRRSRLVIWRKAENPYPGLASFTDERAMVFFGRDGDVRELANRLKQGGSDPRSRFIPLVGPSGSGKTSLIQAGIVPRLPRNWRVVGPFSPGADPFLAFMNALTADSEDPHRQQRISRAARLLRDEARAVFRGEAPGHSELSSHLLAAQGSRSRVLIVIDQWEELNGLTTAGDRELFGRLMHCVLAKHPAVHVIAAMRPEVLADLSNPELSGLFGAPYPIAGLEPRLIRQAIEGPARAAGADFEPGLVDQMVAEATIGDALPLLGYLLERLYEGRDNENVITFESYESSGRVAGAIAAHADEIYRELATVHRTDEIDRTLLKFVQWNGREAIRRPISADRLGETGRRVVEEFRAARLIIDVQSGSAFELAHDALIRQWHKLRDLVEANERELRWYAVLEQRAHDWTPGAGSDDLLRGQALKEAEELEEVSESIAEFVSASRAMEQLELEQRSARAAAYAQQLRNHDADLALAVAVATVTETVPGSSALLTLWGMVEDPRITRLAMGHVGSLCTMAWHADGETLLSIAKDGTGCTWDPSGKLLKFVNIPVGFTEAELSPNGESLLLKEENGRTSLWQVEGFRFIARSKGASDYLPSFRWSDDGSKLLKQAGRTTTIWKVRDREEGKIRQHDISMPAATPPSWSPDGKSLAFVDKGKVTIVDDHDGEILYEFSTRADLEGAHWAPDGQRLCVIINISESQSTLEPKKQIVEIYTSEGELIVRREATGVKSIEWSPDGHQLAVLSGAHPKGRRVEIWDTDRLSTIRSRETSTEVDATLRWSSHGRYLAFYCERRILLWDLENDQAHYTVGGPVFNSAWQPRTGRSTVRFLNPKHWYVCGPETKDLTKWPQMTARSVLSYSPGGSHIATESSGKVSIWKPGAAEPLATLEVRPDWADHATWSPDGKYLAIASHDFWQREENRVIVWDWRDKTTKAMKGEGGQSGPLAWSPDGTLLAGIIEQADSIAIWSINSGETRSTIHWTGKATAMCWSAAAPHVIAASRGDFQIRVLDWKSGDTVCTCIGHGSEVEQLDWSPDGRYLTSADSEGEIRLWNGSTGECLVALDGPGRKPQITWSEDGKQLSAASMVTNVIYDWSLPEDAQELIAKAGVVQALTKHDRQRAGLP